MGKLRRSYKRLFIGLLIGFALCQCSIFAETLPYPLFKNNTGKTVIERISQGSQWLSDVMIISQKGTVIIVDPYDTTPKFISTVKPDIICITHMQHQEHVDMNLLSKFSSDKKVKKSFQKVESFSVKDVKVTGIASAHSADGKVNDQEPENVIYVFEVDGLRIAHLGGFGQKELSESQLQTLGKIDIALIEFVNYPTIHMAMENCIHIAQQLDPQIIIPTHRNTYSIDELGGILKLPVERIVKIMAISKSGLDAGGKKIVDLTNPLE